MDNMINNTTSFMNGMFGKLGSGMCRITANGNIAVKAGKDYKYYNVKTGRLTNCANFVLPVSDDFFFVVPTSKVNVGDVILVDDHGIRKPRCVKEVKGDSITVINYETSTIETILPERHIFMGNVYFYGKIVSIFGQNLNGKKSGNNIFKYMMMSEMFKGMSGNNTNAGNSFGNMLPMMMLMNGGGNGFSDLFDFDLFGEGALPTDILEDAEEEEEEEETIDAPAPAKKSKK